MLSFRSERINYTLLFFAQKHYTKTNKYLSQTALYKYLAFFEFRLLEKTGEMPLELQYKAMEHGPVPIEIYSNRDNPGYFSSVIFEPVQYGTGQKGYIVKPNGKFNSDYFSDVELEEMNSLIEFFAQRWVTASIMSDSSHREIRAWRETYKTNPDGMIDPISDFSRDLLHLSEDELTSVEERFLIQKSIRDFACA